MATSAAITRKFTLGLENVVDPDLVPRADAPAALENAVGQPAEQKKAH
jgi:hypothetical protein